MSPFQLSYVGEGRRNRLYKPMMMGTVLIYGRATEVFLSRRIARKLNEDIAFRVLCGGSFLRPRTICEFRQRHLGDFWHLFLKFARLSRGAGITLRESCLRTTCAASARLQAGQHGAADDERVGSRGRTGTLGVAAARLDQGGSGLPPFRRRGLGEG